LNAFGNKILHFSVKPLATAHAQWAGAQAESSPRTTV